MDTIEKTIKEFIYKNLVIFEDEVDLSNDDNIFELGFVNSLFIIKLVDFIEKSYSIEVEPEDVSISDFNSVDRIRAFIESKKDN